MTRPLRDLVSQPAAGDDLHGRAREVLAQLPPGTAGAATASLRRGLTAAGRLDDLAAPWLAPDAVAAQLVRPLLAVDHWPGPSQPLSVGDGAVHADLIDEDHDRLAILRSILTDVGPVDAEILAAEAQDWRLPVTPYRDLPAAPPAVPAVPTPAAGGAGVWERRPLVVDLTSLWAGPLATSLLADLGARVVKVDPDCRPDGFREHRSLYAQLNGAKEIVDLDLRRDGDRRRFEALVDEASLVIDSFSRRVMPNFGYGPDDLRRRNPGVATLSIVAFPAGTREAGWVSYGPGVHACCGLGTHLDGAGRRRFQPAPVAYPDALAGMEAFAVGAELLAGGALDGSGPAALPHREVSLAGALAPVVAQVIADRTARRTGDG